MLLHQIFEASAARLPGKAALVCGEHRYTYAELAQRVAAFAAVLQSRGIRRGDRVAIFLDNGVDAITAVYAAMRVGAIFMPINPLTKRDKLAYMLNDAGAAALVTQELLGEVWRHALAQNASVHSALSVDAAADADARIIAVGPRLPVAPAPAEVDTIDVDLASIIYTSGSTGDPKGVMLTHASMCSAATSITTYLGLLERDVVLCALPLAFDYGLYQVFLSFQVGATLVVEKSFAFPAKVLETMQRERVSVFPGVPTMFSMLMGFGALAKFDLGSLRVITNTAAALSERHIQEIRRMFPTARLYSMYGLTECKRVTYLPPEQLDIRPTSVGRGMPNEQVWLVDERGERLPNGSTGELVIRGMNVMRGYWGKPEATAQRLKPGPYPGEMVLYSGDVFRTDAEGYLYFVSRKDDIIKSRGEKVSPKEVEDVLYGLEGVQEAAVVGVPDDLLGEAVKAFIVLREGFRYTERDVIRHCLGHLENFMAPKHVEFVAALPKTDTGKITRKGLA